MNATEAEQIARDYFYGTPGLFSNTGFEIVNISRLDWNKWTIECHVFSMIGNKMVKYRVIIHDDKIQSIEEVE